MTYKESVDYITKYGGAICRRKWSHIWYAVWYGKVIFVRKEDGIPCENQKLNGGDVMANDWFVIEPEKHSRWWAWNQLLNGECVTSVIMPKGSYYKLIDDYIASMFNEGNKEIGYELTKEQWINVSETGWEIIIPSTNEEL
jgi:hypothetical protein